MRPCIYLSFQISLLSLFWHPSDNVELHHLRSGPTGAAGFASEIKIFVHLHLPPCLLSAISRQKLGVLTFPEVSECVKGNFKRVTE